MKIGITCPASLPATQFGGILFLAVDLARELANEKHEVVIYTTDLDLQIILIHLIKNYRGRKISRILRSYVRMYGSQLNYSSSVQDCIFV